MLQPYRPNGLSVPQPPVQPLLAPGRAVVRHYQLAARVLEGAGGQQRTVLGLRRYLAAQEPWHRRPDLRLSEASMARPLVLRASLGETIEAEVSNLLPHTALCLALVDDDYKIFEPASAVPIAPGETRTCIWRCCHAGIYPIYNCACTDVVERRNLLGVLIIEP